jgi:RimJ/RimL family protein N-acetyltransferase
LNHTFSIDGYSYYLCPVTTDDAAFIVEARLEDQERNKFIHIISPDISKQIEWIKNYYSTTGDYYFTVRNKFTKNKEGLISLYDINDNKAEWGRWVIKKESLAAVESFYLICRIAFEQLELEEIYSRTIEDNKIVVAFHDSVNTQRRGIINNCFKINGRMHNAIEHFVSKERFFNEIKPKLDRILIMMAGKNYVS